MIRLLREIESIAASAASLTCQLIRRTASLPKNPLSCYQSVKLCVNGLSFRQISLIVLAAIYRITRCFFRRFDHVCCLMEDFMGQPSFSMSSGFCVEIHEAAGITYDPAAGPPQPHTSLHVEASRSQPRHPSSLPSKTCTIAADEQDDADQSG